MLDMTLMINAIGDKIEVILYTLTSLVKLDADETAGWKVM